MMDGVTRNHIRTQRNKIRRELMEEPIRDISRTCQAVLGEFAARPGALCGRVLPGPGEYCGIHRHFKPSSSL